VVRDFDSGRHERRAEREQADRTFVLGGETFVYRAEVSYTVLEKISEQSEMIGADLIRSIEKSVVELLEPGQEERFLAVARAAEDPFTWEDLNELSTWLTEVQMGRPTQALSPSGDGDGTTETPLKDASFSEPAVASAA
jgi:hypothetical protein